MCIPTAKRLCKSFNLGPIREFLDDYGASLSLIYWNHRVSSRKFQSNLLGSMGYGQDIDPQGLRQVLSATSWTSICPCAQTSKKADNGQARETWLGTIGMIPSRA